MPYLEKLMQQSQGTLGGGSLQPNNLYSLYQRLRDSRGNMFQQNRQMPMRKNIDYGAPIPQAPQQQRGLDLSTMRKPEPEVKPKPQAEEASKPQEAVPDVNGTEGLFVFQGGEFAPTQQPQQSGAAPYLGGDEYADDYGHGSYGSNYKVLNTAIQEGIEDEGLQNTNPELVYGVDALNAWVNDMFGAQLTVSGGWRSPEHNAEVNGSSTSHHLHGNALDVVIPDNLSEKELDVIKEKALSMGFNADGEDMYHDRGSGYHLHLTLPKGLY